MKVKDIFPHLSLNKKIKDLRIRGISDDSRCVAEGDLFFIRKGKNFDIFSVLGMLEKKRIVFVADIKDKRKVSTRVKKAPVIFVKNINKVFRQAVDAFYGFSKEDFTFIGVTGTNGKTTTAYFIYDILKKLGKKVCLIGTVNYIIGDKAYRANFTTPGFLDLRKIFKKAKIKGCEYVVMEVSSHGLEQRRVKGIDFSRCVFTNLSRDHLDYHKTMKNYFAAKKRLFKNNNGSLAVINKDDHYGRKLLKENNRSISYGIEKKSDFMAGKIKSGKDGMSFNLMHDGKKSSIKTPLYGRFNVLNILAGVTALSSLGFPMARLIKFTRSFKGAEGRLQMVVPGIFVDYAHTPDALKNAILTLRDIGYKNVICVFGCGGQRDRGKRKIMGKIASKRADFSFITADNPRLESVDDICNDIKRGFDRENYSIITDRKDAIKAAMVFRRVRYKKDSCILIAGKGHEDYQIIGTKRLPFKDARVVRALAKKIK